MTGHGRVPPATSLAREVAVQRMAGIQYPVAVGSVRLGNERSPRLAVVGCHGWIDGRGEAAVDDVSSVHQRQASCLVRCPALRLLSAARRNATHRACAIAWERADFPSARPIRRLPGNPHGCWTSYSRFSVNPKIALTVTLRRQLSATFLPSDLPSDRRASQR